MPWTPSIHALGAQYSLPIHNMTYIIYCLTVYNNTPLQFVHILLCFNPQGLLHYLLGLKRVPMVFHLVFIYVRVYLSNFRRMIFKTHAFHQLGIWRTVRSPRWYINIHFGSKHILKVRIITVIAELWAASFLLLVSPLFFSIAVVYKTRNKRMWSSNLESISCYAYLFFIVPYESSISWKFKKFTDFKYV